jgi:excinuclease UvrABC nuclease subunit
MHYVYRHYDSDGELLYIGQTYSWQTRTDQHKNLAVWWDAVTRIELERYKTMTEACNAERELIIALNPKFNVTNNSVNKKPKAAPKNYLWVK